MGEGASVWVFFLVFLVSLIILNPVQRVSVQLFRMGGRDKTYDDTIGTGVDEGTYGVSVFGVGPVVVGHSASVI